MTVTRANEIRAARATADTQSPKIQRARRNPAGRLLVVLLADPHPGVMWNYHSPRENTASQFIAWRWFFATRLFQYGLRPLLYSSITTRLGLTIPFRAPAGFTARIIMAVLKVSSSSRSRSRPRAAIKPMRAAAFDVHPQPRPSEERKAMIGDAVPGHIDKME